MAETKTIDMTVRPSEFVDGLGYCPLCGSLTQLIARTTLPPTYYSMCPTCGWRSGISNEDPDSIVSDQEAKADAGKAQLTLVPRRILYDIARVREYGNAKYHDPNNWKQVAPQRYRDAMMRHMVAYLDDPDGADEESGLPHLWHLACNVAFLCEMEAKK